MSLPDSDHVDVVVVVCGSDLHSYFAILPPSPTTLQPHPVTNETLPVVMGHECVYLILSDACLNVRTGSRAPSPNSVQGQIPRDSTSDRESLCMSFAHCCENRHSKLTPPQGTTDRMHEAYLPVLC